MGISIKEIEMEVTWTFAVLEALAFALVGALEGELEIWKAYVNKRLFLYLRALLASGAFVASQVYSNPPDEVLLVLGALVVFLGVLGYWPKVQEIDARWIRSNR